MALQSRARLGPRSQAAGTGRPLLVVRNEILRKGRRDYYIDPVMPPPGAQSPSDLLLAAVRTALEDRGWVYAPEEAVELMLYYENPGDGTWFPLTDGAYNNIFSKLKLPRPKLQLRAKKTLPTKVQPIDTKNPPGPKDGGTLGGPGPGDVKRVHVDGRWQLVSDTQPQPFFPWLRVLFPCTDVWSTCFALSDFDGVRLVGRC